MKAKAIPTSILHFRDPGSTVIWEAKNEFKAAGFIPAVTGVHNGKMFQPRLADIVILSRRARPICEVIG